MCTVQAGMAASGRKHSWGNVGSQVAFGDPLAIGIAAGGLGSDAYSKRQARETTERLSERLSDESTERERIRRLVAAADPFDAVTAGASARRRLNRRAGYSSMSLTGGS